MTVVGGFRISDSRYLSLSRMFIDFFILMVLDCTFMILYSIAHHGAGCVLTASRPSRQKVDGIIVEDSGTLGALDAVRAIYASRTTVWAVFFSTRIFKVQS